MSIAAVIVGNGGSLLGSGLGKFIDQHERVVRFNAFATQGFEADVGTRSTDWFTVMRAVTEDKRVALPWHQIWVHSWEPHPNRCKTLQSHLGLSTAPVQKVPHAWVKQISETLGTTYQAWSTGALAIWGLVHDLQWGPVNVVGFDWWQDPAPPHHYADKVQRGPLHQPQKEKQLIDYLIDQGKVTLHG